MDFSPSIALSSLLPEDTSAFYRYSGSLTTPQCNEVVTWTLLHHPVGVSESQLAGLRALIDGDGNTMGDNFRAVQPLFGRKVTANGLGSFGDQTYESGGTTRPVVLVHGPWLGRCAPLFGSCRKCR